MILLTLIFACGEQTIKEVPNSLPTVQIQSHGDNSAFDDGYEVQFYAQVSDQNHENEELQVAWYEGENLICDWEIPDPSGVTRCNVVMTEGMARVSVQVIDPEQGAGRDEIDIVVNPTDAPTATIFSPQVGENYYSDQLVLFQGVIADTEDDATDLTVEWTSSLDGVLSLNTTPTSLGEIEDYATLTSGQHAIKLTVVDTTGKSTVDSVVIDVAGPNNEPECEITLPQSGEAYIIGQNVEFQGTATDTDINNSLLNITWESDIDGTFNSFAPNSDGELTVVYNQLSSGNHIIKLSVEDEVGGLCTDTVQIAVGTAPVLSVTSPTDGTVYSVGDSVSFIATVSDQEDISSDISLLWTSDIDGELSSSPSDSSGNVSFNKSNLSAGLHSLSVVATDSTGLTASDARSFRVNTPPNTPVISISPTSPYTNEGLVTMITSTDDDGDNVTFAYTWLQDGNSTSYTGTGITAVPSIPSSATAAGETWTLQITPNDGYTDGTMAQSNIIIENSLPEITSVTIDTTNPYNDDVIQCSAVADDLDETLVPEFTWTVNSSMYTGSSLDISTTTAMPTNTITCTASVEDAFGETFELSDSVVVENRTPTVDSITTSQSTVYTSSTVDCVATVSDSDGETVEPVYSWTLDGQPFAGNESSVTLSPEQVGVGETLVCSALVTDGSNESDSDEITWVIANTEPVIDSLTLTPEEPFVDDELLCEVTVSDADNDDVTATFEWENLTTGDTYPSTTTSDLNATLDTSTISVQSDDIIECTVSITDEFGGLNGDSLSITMLNSGPIFTSEASISPNTSAKTGAELTCSAEGSDPNDGVLVVSYNWNVGGVAVGTSDSETYIVDADETDVGNVIECVASVEDIDGETAESTATVTVENTEPTVESVSLDQSVAYNDTTLICSSTVSDPDETPNTTYTWQKNGSDLVNGQSIVLSDYNVMPEDEIGCIVVAKDSSNTEDSQETNIVLSNRDPVLAPPVISLTEVEANGTLTCSTTVTDDDGESLTPEYTWTVGNNTPVVVSSITLDPLTAVVGSSAVCSIVVNDGYGGSDSKSVQATVINTPPTISTTSITSTGNIEVGETLTCSATGNDLNDGILDVSYQWTNETEGTSLGEEETLLLDNSDVQGDDIIKCVAIVTDNNSQTASSQNTVTIINSGPSFTSEASISPNTGVKTGTELTCTAEGSDPNDGTLSVSYNWNVGGVVVGSENSETYIVDADETDVGSVIECVASVEDIDGETAESKSTVTVENTAPTVDSVGLDQSVAYNDSVINCSYTTTDPDETPNVDVVWTVGGTDVQVNGPLDLATTAALPEDEVVCTVTVTDTQLATDTDFASITITNRVPTQPTVSISPSAPTVGVDDLTCTALSTDPDGTTPNYSYEWTQNGSSTSHTTNTIASSDTSAGDTWECIVTPDDGIDFGDSNSSSVTVASACALTDCDMSVDLGNGIGADFVLIEGSDLVDPSNRYTLDNAFYMMTTEVTQGMFQEVMGYDSRTGQSTSYGDGDNYPAYYASWHMSAHFANTLSIDQGEQECYSCSGSGTSVTCSETMDPYLCSGYSLPTAHEWEIAARSGTTSEFWTGEGSSLGGTYSSNDCNTSVTIQDGVSNPPLSDYAWFCGNSNSSTQEVGTKLPNGFGLYDMHGNLREWTSDWYGCTYPNGGTWCNSGSDRVYRGGSWSNYPHDLRSSNRSYYYPTYRHDFNGFRLRKIVNP
jgi:formylglycine-generating enzyme required for sulfatase activity